MSKFKKKYSNFRTQDKLLINIDWLTLNIYDNFTMTTDTDFVYKSGNFALKREEKRTALYNTIVSVHYKGQYFAEITCNPHNVLMSPDRAHVKFENYLLYADNFKEKVFEFLNEFDLMRHGVRVSRLDIAVDGAKISPFINDYYFKESTCNFQRVRKTQNIKFSNDVSQHEILNKNVSAWYVGDFGDRKKGRKKTPRFVRVYNKLAELEQKKGKKDYILNYYKLNGFDLSKGVERFEVELKPKFLQTLDGFHFEQIFDKKRLIDIFQTSIKGFFEFRLKDNDRMSRCTAVQLFKFDSTPMLYLKKAVSLLKSPLRVVKMSIRNTFNELTVGTFATTVKGDPLFNQKVSDHMRLAIDYIKRMVSLYGLTDWFNSVFDRWVYDTKLNADKFNISLNYQLLESTTYINK